MRFIWEDLADPALPLLVYLVTPEPPFSIQPGTFGTLLLIQNPHPFRAVCLVTVVEPAVTEIAHSFDIVVPFQHILFHVMNAGHNILVIVRFLSVGELFLMDNLFDFMKEWA